jgi:hypothetical protein
MMDGPSDQNEGLPIVSGATGPARPDYNDGFAAGYSRGYRDADERQGIDVVDEMALTFSHADLFLLGAGLLALLVPLGILLTRTGERPRWRAPWSWAAERP